VDFALAEPSVKSVSLGRIESAPSANSRHKLKISPELAGLRCFVRGKKYVQEIWVYWAESFERYQVAQIIAEGSLKLEYKVVVVPR
jgi:hypothetical protein